MNKMELDQILEKSFRTEPGFQLPDDFAKRVSGEVVRRTQWKNDLFEYLNIMAVLILLLAAVSGIYYLVDKDFLLKVFSFVSGNILQVILIAFILNFIFLTDRVLLRLLFNRWNRT